MSSYQQYEFLALDGPISDEGLQYARRCSSRADVSRYRWANSYHWGDFSGNVERLLEYYDAFYYFADWGSFRFAVAFPEGCLLKEAIEPYLTDGLHEFGAGLSCSSGAGRRILTWDYHEEAVCWDDLEGMEGLLGRLSAIREQVMLGDYRALFLAWLSNFDSEWVDDGEDFIPPIPPGMGQLPDALRCLAEQLRVEEDSLQAAAELSSGSWIPELIPIADVVDALSTDEMKQLLVRVAEGAEGRVKAELIQKTRLEVVAVDAPRVTRAKFAERALKIREAQRREQAIKKAEKRREEEQIRQAHLERIFKQAESRWKLLDQLLEKKNASVYDTAARRLKELRDAYMQTGEADQFAERLSVFRTQYGCRPALMRRLDEL
jgi:hypothetical protein